jgi:hypothetical protein
MATPSRKVELLAYVNTTDSTAITGTQEALTSFDRNVTLSANTIRSGDVFIVEGTIVHTATTGAETHDIQVGFGGATLLTVTGIDPADNDVFYFRLRVVFRSVGTAGSIQVDGIFISGAPGAATARAVRTDGQTVDTTANMLVSAKIDRQAAATDSDSAFLENFAVSKLQPYQV